MSIVAFARASSLTSDFEWMIDVHSSFYQLYVPAVAQCIRIDARSKIKDIHMPPSIKFILHTTYFSNEVLHMHALSHSIEHPFTCLSL